IFFAHKVGQVLRITSQTRNEGRERVYTIVGQVFFASSEKFTASFDFKEVIEKVVIDLSRARFWDITAISSMDSVILKFRREGTEVE
ncbi:MAG TPA: sodium-independent anion transporter, partial [Pusillimonas sp.]|nr:sodium-independent anion transporter [Pusillimonas sp.]